ncbi:MAG TPA: hypothetical protein DCY25_07100 [Bacteroidales bacterium]|nr:hypothetical protein [Bacteroidales bacterium]
MSVYSEYLRFFLLDSFSGTRVLSNYRTMTDSFSWSRERLIEYQTQKLKALLNHSFENVPYYKELFRKCGMVPGDIKDLDDLKLLPILTRDLLTDHYDLLSDTNNKYRVRIYGSSSGTTGIPVKYVHDGNCEGAGIAAGYALYSLSGWRMGSRRLHIWGNPSSVAKWKRSSSRLKRLILNQRNYPSYLLNDPENYNGLLSFINEFKPEFIDGYAGPIGSFACWLREKNITIKGVKAVFTTAENLIYTHRSAITEVIAPVSDLYGSGEINGIAIQPVFSDKYYILGSHVIVEQEDFNDSSALVVTDLDSRLMPFIRYRIGDVIDALHKPHNSEALPFDHFNFIDGRIADFIKLPNGIVIHPINILGGTYLRKYPEIRRHRVVWDGSVLDFVLELSGRIDMVSLQKAIQENLSHYDVSFKITVKDRLESAANGKFRYIEINDLSVK